jgi:hypothetical protein
MEYKIISIPGWENHLNGQECCVSILKTKYLSKDLCKEFFLNINKEIIFSIYCSYLNPAKQKSFSSSVFRGSNAKFAGEWRKSRSVQPQLSLFQGEFVKKILMGI